MKGALSSPDMLFYTRAHQQVFTPPSPYTHVSGGDPQVIPQLTHAQLCQYHRQHYRPENAWILTYGDLPLQGHLAKIDECLRAAAARNNSTNSNNNTNNNNNTQDNSVSTSAKAIRARTAVPSEPARSEHRRVTFSCPVNEAHGSASAAAQTTMSVSFVLPADASAFDRFVMRVVGSLLVDTQNAPLYKALMEDKELAPANLAPNTGLDAHAKNPVFSVGVQVRGCLFW